MKSGKVEELHYLLHLIGSFLFITESFWRSGHPQFDMSFDKWSFFDCWLVRISYTFLICCKRLFLFFRFFHDHRNVLVLSDWLTYYQQCKKCNCSLITTTSHAKNEFLMNNDVCSSMDGCRWWWSMDRKFLLHLCAE